MDFLDADRLAGKDLAEVDLFVAQTDAAAASDHDGFVVEGAPRLRVAVNSNAHARSARKRFCVVHQLRGFHFNGSPSLCALFI